MKTLNSTSSSLSISVHFFPHAPERLAIPRRNKNITSLATSQSACAVLILVMNVAVMWQLGRVFGGGWEGEG